jgi:orotidine-5'-phosphate decarboxylase
MPELVVALDYPDARSALGMAQLIAGEVRWVKVGLELYTACGPEIVRPLSQMGLKVFLDLKLMDIPNTVHGAVRAACALEVDMLTLHILGGREMVDAAVRARDDHHDKGGGRPLLFGVTLLTSLAAGDLPWPSELATGEVIAHLASRGAAWGLDGVVCSGAEVSRIKSSTPRPILCLTPGIRRSGPQGDQRRTATPEEAVAAGSDFLVVGRPITGSADPLEQTRAFQAAIQAAMSA